MSNEKTRSGACRECLQKHLLKAEGYAEELREDASRVWEKRQLLKNLMLAEDHAIALGDDDARDAIRSARIGAESGFYIGAAELYDKLFDASCGCRKKTVSTVSTASTASTDSTEKGGEF